MQGAFIKPAGGHQIFGCFRALALRMDDRRIIRGQPDGLGKRSLARLQAVAVASDGGGAIAGEVHPGNLQPGRHEIRVQLDGGLQQTVELGQRRSHDARPQDDLAGLEVVVVSVDAGGGPAGDDIFLLRGDGGLKRPGDLGGELFLNGENVADLAIVSLGPDMLVGGGADELAGHAHLVAGPPHAALEQVGDAQFLGDLPAGLRRAAILHDRGARHDAQLRDEREVGEDVLLDAVGEKGAVLLLAHVAERKDGEGFLADGRGGRFRCFDRAGGRARRRFGFGRGAEQHEGAERQDGDAKQGHGPEGKTGLGVRGWRGRRERNGGSGSGGRFARRLQEAFYLLDKLRRGLAPGQAGPLRLQERLGDAGGGFAGVVDDHGKKKRHALGQQMGAFDGQFPFEPEVAFPALIALAGDDRHEEGALLDLAADLLVPDIAAAQLAHVEPDLDPKGAQGVGDPAGRVSILAGIAEKNRFLQWFGHGWVWTRPRARWPPC